MAESPVRAIGDGWYVVENGGSHTRVAIARDENSTWIFVDGFVTQVVQEPPNTARRRAKGRGEGSVMAPMPATVVAINTTAGQQVNEGDTLIVLEAMKMELPLKSPRSGRVKAVHCAKGDLVQPGVNLLEIE
ncbi:MAG TPA: biotin/lipoyl-containing protein [Vicinamibacterales bacterium]|nr:biotin/lipoyl-containing protein [Vicinamibacterales bacterium]